MRRLIGAVAASLLLTLALAGSAAAQDTCDTGLEFAMEHIVPLAQEGLLGTEHVPGEHMGFAGAPPVC